MKTQTLLLIILIAVLAHPVSAGQSFIKQIIFEGESLSYETEGHTYNVTLLAVFDSQLKVQFEVNGERTDVLGEDDSHRLEDGTVIFVRSVLPQEAGEGSDMVQFNLYTADHPEAEASEEETAEVMPAVEPAATMVEREPAKEMQPSPKKEAVIDITKKQPTRSWWESLIDWLKNLFR